MKTDIRTITINSKFKSALLKAEELAFLDEYLNHYNHIKFITTSYIKHKNHVGKPISQIKSECDRNNILPYRLFNNSIYRGLIGQVQSQLSNKKNYLDDTLADIRSVEKKVEKCRHKVKLIDCMKPHLRLTTFNRNDRAKNIKRATTLHNKLLRLNAKADRLKKELDQGDFKVCYGTSSLLKKRNAIHKNDRSKLNAWKREWALKRFGEMLFVGSTDETMGNSNSHVITANVTEPKAQLHKNNIRENVISTKLHQMNNPYYLRITVPSSLKHKYGFAHVIIPVRIAYYQKELQAHLDYHTYHKKSGAFNTVNEKGEVVKPTSSLSVRLMKDKNGDFDVAIGISSSLHMKPELKTVEKYGLVGVDLNPDHIDVAETDEKGNYVKGWTIPLDLKNKSTKQRKTVLSQAIKQVVDYALLKGKSVAIEKLDFTQKKKALRDNYNKQYAKMLTSFAYSKVKEYFANQCWKSGVNLISVNPAYTSFLGNLKYRLKTANKVDFDSHVSAAFVIARRAQGFKEKIPKTIQVIKYDEDVLTVEQKSLWKMTFDATKTHSFRELRRIQKAVLQKPKKHKALIVLNENTMSTFFSEKLSGFPLYQKLYVSYRFDFTQLQSSYVLNI